MEIGYQAEGVFNWLTHQGKSARSTTGPPGSSVATKSAGQLGREGEAAASAITGVGKNTKKFLVNGRNRIPDQVNGPQHPFDVGSVPMSMLQGQLIN